MKDLYTKNILEYLDNLIEKYIDCNSSDKKVKYACDIYMLNMALYMNNVIDMLDYFKIINKINTKDMNEINEYYKNKNEKTLNQFKTVVQSDIEYINYLLKQINIPDINENEKILNKMGIEDYIESNIEFFKYYNDKKNDIFYNSNIIDANTVFLRTENKSLIIIKEPNTTHLIHEIMHDYSMGIHQRYRETPSILLELGMQSKQNFLINYRLNDLKQFKKMILKKEYQNEDFNFVTLSYGIGILMSIPIIYKYGNDFNTLLNISNFIIENDKLNVETLLKELNINQNNINDSYKKVTKILKI